jgi:glycosyltransferase involved in cell wall biosynthesis
LPLDAWEHLANTGLVAGATDIFGSGGKLSPLAFLEEAPTVEPDPVISVVVPLCNEAETVAVLYQQVAEALPNIFWEIVYVDDGSTDESYAELVRLHGDHSNVLVVRLRRNFGKATALSAGFDVARGAIIVTIDADLQDDPGEIPRLLEKLDEGYDLVSGWKCTRRDSFSRRLLSRIYNGATGIVTGVRLHDMNCGLKIYRAEVLRSVRLYGELHRFIPVLAHHRGFRTAELPVNHRQRAVGQSRYGFERYARGFFDLLTVAYLGRYRNRPLHFFGGIGMLLGFVGSCILVYLTALKVGGESIGGRPLLMLGVLLLVVGVQFFSLGLVGELLTSHNEERAAAQAPPDRRHVRDTLV